MRFALACTLVLSSAVFAQIAPAPPWSHTVEQPALNFAERTGLTLYFDHQRLVGNDRGWAASVIPLRNGGFALTGNRNGRPLVMRVDRSLREVWTHDLGERGFKAFEAASVLELEDGTLVALVYAFPTPSSAASTRLTGLGPDGVVKWTKALRYQGFVGSPFPLIMKRGAKNAVLLRGHVGVGGEKYAWWEGRLDAQGKLTHDVMLEAFEPSFRTFMYDRMEPTSVE